MQAALENESSCASAKALLQVHAVQSIIAAFNLGQAQSDRLLQYSWGGD